MADTRTATPDLTTLDRNWIKFGLERTKESIKRQMDATKTTETVREALKRDLASIDATISKIL